MSSYYSTGSERGGRKREERNATENDSNADDTDNIRKYTTIKHEQRKMERNMLGNILWTFHVLQFKSCR